MFENRNHHSTNHHRSRNGHRANALVELASLACGTSWSHPVAFFIPIHHFSIYRCIVPLIPSCVNILLWSIAVPSVCSIRFHRGRAIPTKTKRKSPTDSWRYRCCWSPSHWARPHWPLVEPFESNLNQIEIFPCLSHIFTNYQTRHSLCFYSIVFEF